MAFLNSHRERIYALLRIVAGLMFIQHGLQKIFGLFERLHDAQAYPGTGVGLALVRKGAERMGGRVGLESEPGQGSTFFFTLPIREEQTS